MSFQAEPDQTRERNGTVCVVKLGVGEFGHEVGFERDGARGEEESVCAKEERVDPRSVDLVRCFLYWRGWKGQLMASVYPVARHDDRSKRRDTSKHATLHA